MRTSRTALALFAAGLLALTAGCTRVDQARTSTGAGLGTGNGRGPAAELRLGYFPNITHAVALIGARRNLVSAELGTGTRLTTQTFNDGTEAVAALLGGSLDVAFVGPGPAINAFARSSGAAVRIVAGAASGGAQLVVRPGITRAEQLRGTRIATPKLGNTQDIALKTWLSDRHVPATGGPDGVTVVNADNPQTLDAFRGGQLDGAWLPEPWASRLVLDAGATVLQDEARLWPGGRFPTTVVLVRTEFLRDHPQTVRAFLRAELAAIDFATTQRAQARTAVNDALRMAAGRPLSDGVLSRAFDNLTLTADPLAAAFPRLAQDMVTAGLQKSAPDLAGLFDLSALDAVLTAAGRPTVEAAGLDARK